MFGLSSFLKNDLNAINFPPPKEKISNPKWIKCRDNFAKVGPKYICLMAR